MRKLAGKRRGGGGSDYQDCTANRESKGEKNNSKDLEGGKGGEHGGGKRLGNTRVLEQVELRGGNGFHKSCKEKKSRKKGKNESKRKRNLDISNKIRIKVAGK